MSAPSRTSPATAAHDPRTPTAIEWALALGFALLALLALRRAPLSTPFYWDAAAVYAPGSRWVAEHHFAAVPGVFPSLLGRGHTTLYYVVTAAAFRLLGYTPVAGHVPVLLFGALALAFTYLLGAWLFGRPAGVAAAALLAASPLFLTMSSETLPEVPITALTAASLYAYARGRIGWAAAAGTALVLTKETGVAGPLAIVGAMLWEARREHMLRARARDLALACVPLAALGAFFVWQRVVEGWWVLPYHAELFRAEHSIARQGVYVLQTIVAQDGRGVALVAAAAFALARRMRGRRAWASDAPVEGTARSSVVLAIGLVLAANVVFFAKMFFIERYALPAHVGVAVVIAGTLVPARVRLRQHAIEVLAVIAAVALGVGAREGGTGFQSGETTFRYLRAVDTRTRLYRTLAARATPPVVLTGWPMNDELREPWLGWADRPYRVMSVGWFVEHGRRGPDGRAIGAVVVANGLDHTDALRDEAARLGFRLTARETEGDAWAELWEP